MYKFGKKSRANLSQAHPLLQDLFNEVIKGWDCSVLCSHRNEQMQNEAFAAGKSKLKFPKSKHNLLPSHAVDVAPYPIDWNDLGKFYMFAGYVMAVADRMGIKVRYGGDWDGDKKTADQKFHDLPHWELIE